ncbi:MAG: L-rhamnonate dehydratase [Verrucomicrobia bacterium]|nr:MAG: L-rhamnonate dehydratase [Verrucomicrobiota bacterium]
MSPDIITDIRTTDLCFSQVPHTLKRNLCTPTSRFKHDEKSRDAQWFGPVALTLVEVETAGGLVGHGSIGGFTSAGTEIVNTYLKPLAIGHSIFETELLWDKMVRSTVRYGRRGVALCAVSGIDIACWDLKGKLLGQPVYNLLGGKTRDRVQAYASRLYAMEDLDALAEEARGYVKQGFKVLKQRFGFAPIDGTDGMNRNVALIRAVREAVGDDIEIAADAYMGWDYGYAVEMEKRLRPYRMAWIEEPFLPDDLGSYVKLREKSQTLISCGEHEYTKQGFQQLIDLRACDILQPDTNRVGGITEMKKICALAEAAGLPIYPHSNEAHNFHVIVSQTNCPLVEYFPNVEPDTGNELFWKVFTGEPTAVDGYLSPSDKPGLGIEINHAAVEKLRWKP